MKQIRFDPSDGLIKVAASISGSKKHNYQVVLAIDTGSYLTTIRPEIAGIVGCTVHSGNILLTGIAETVDAAFGTLSGISVAGITIKKCNVAIHNIPAAYSIDGLLGNDFFQQHKICIDYINGILSIQ